jgi:cell division protein ZapD
MNSAVELSAIEPENTLIRFEQPLTERMRTFLRVELLYEQTRFHIDDPSDFGARAAVSGVFKELERHAELLAKYRSQPGVDPSRLTQLIEDIEELRERLAGAGPHLMNPLKECDFLTAIRHRSAIPGGTCTFDLPDYGYWLSLPGHERRRQLEEWADRLQPLCDAVAEVLWLTREATEPEESTAPAGLYQQSFDRNEQVNLVRVLVPSEAGIYPEISAGQHRFTVRFVRWRGVDARPTQVTQDVHFLLAIC